MSDEDEPQQNLGEIIASNRERLEQVMAEARSAGGKWVVEFRDMWDSQDSDGGVYFVVCKTDRAVDRVAYHCGTSGLQERLLGVFDVSRTPDEQWPGLTLDQWHARRAAESWPIIRKLKALFN